MALVLEAVGTIVLEEFISKIPKSDDSVASCVKRVSSTYYHPALCFI